MVYHSKPFKTNTVRCESNVGEEWWGKEDLNLLKREHSFIALAFLRGNPGFP
jgi:hypothetical protein